MTALDAVHRVALLLVDCEARLERERRISVGISKALGGKMGELKRERKLRIDSQAECGAIAQLEIELAGTEDALALAIVSRDKAHKQIAELEAELDKFHEWKSEQAARITFMDFAEKRLAELKAEVLKWKGLYESHLTALKAARDEVQERYKQLIKAREQIAALTFALERECRPFLELIYESGGAEWDQVPQILAAIPEPEE